jgi:hypothetical protein
MDRDQLIRRALHATAVMNAGAAPLFAFPETFGWIMGLPAAVPRVYALMVGLFVGLFGAVYAVLARQRVIDRALVALAAAGKTSAVVIVFACWLLGELPARAVLLMGADLAFAAVFAWWLLGDAERRPLPA